MQRPSLCITTDGKQKGLIAFDRTHYIYVIFQSRKFYDVPRVLIPAVRSFQALATILN